MSRGAADAEVRVDHAMDVFEAEVAGERRQGAHDYGDGCGDDGKRTETLVSAWFTLLRNFEHCAGEMGDGEEVKKDGEVAQGSGLVRKELVLEEAPGTVGGEEDSSRS